MLFREVCRPSAGPVQACTPWPFDKKSTHFAESLDFWVLPDGPGHSRKVREAPGQKLKKVEKKSKNVKFQKCERFPTNFKSVNDFRQISKVLTGNWYRCRGWRDGAPVPTVVIHRNPKSSLVRCGAPRWEICVKVLGGRPSRRPS